MQPVVHHGRVTSRLRGGSYTRRVSRHPADPVTIEDPRGGDVLARILSEATRQAGVEVAFGQFCTNATCTSYEWGVKGAFSVAWKPYLRGCSVTARTRSADTMSRRSRSFSTASAHNPLNCFRISTGSTAR